MKQNELEIILRNRQKGFTLLEMLIAVIVLGILAMVIVPQITVSSDDAKVSTVKANLSIMRTAVESYAQQHSNNYPAAVLGNNADAPTAFANQLTLYSLVDGTTNKDKTQLTGTVYGPYMKGAALPTNPFNNLNTVKCDTTTTDITSRPSDGSTGWLFVVKTGALIANDGGTSGGVAHVTY